MRRGQRRGQRAAGRLAHIELQECERGRRLRALARRPQDIVQALHQHRLRRQVPERCELRGLGSDHCMACITNGLVQLLPGRLHAEADRHESGARWLEALLAQPQQR